MANKPVHYILLFFRGGHDAQETPIAISDVCLFHRRGVDAYPQRLWRDRYADYINNSHDWCASEGRHLD